jgi:MOSC domain-containing protein YiiM
MSPGTLVAVCRSDRTGVPKRPLAAGVLRRGHGLEGDAHAGPWHRQVSLLDADDIAEMTRLGLDLEPGDFGENLVVAGVDLAGLGVGSVVAVGGAVLRVTQIGKECHDRCAIYEAAGDCIMPRKGLFAEVIRGGRVEPGCEVRVVETRQRVADGVERIRAHGTLS